MKRNGRQQRGASIKLLILKNGRILAEPEAIREHRTGDGEG